MLTLLAIYSRVVVGVVVVVVVVVSVIHRFNSVNESTDGRNRRLFVRSFFRLFVCLFSGQSRIGAKRKRNIKLQREKEC